MTKSLNLINTGPDIQKEAYLQRNYHIFNDESELATGGTHVL
jgi:hypothetical protein